MSIFDRGIVFPNHKEEPFLNCDTELRRKCIKELRILLLLFFTFLMLSKKENINKKKGNINKYINKKKFSGVTLHY